MTRAYRDRPVTIDDLARELMKECTLEEKLAVSVFVARAKQHAAKQATDAAAEGVIDFQRGWRLK